MEEKDHKPGNEAPSEPGVSSQLTTAPDEAVLAHGLRLPFQPLGPCGSSREAHVWDMPASLLPSTPVY